MAFKLKSNIFNNSTGSPLLNSEKCLEYGIVNGKSECIRRSKEATRTPKPYSKDPEERERQKQWIKNNPEKYKEMIAKTKTLVSTRDIKSGETRTFPKGMYKRLQFYKKQNDPEGYQAFLDHHDIDPKDPAYRAIMIKAEKSLKNRALEEERRKKRRKYCQRYPDKCYKKTKNKVIPSKKKQPSTTTTGKDSLGEWSEYK